MDAAPEYLGVMTYKEGLWTETYQDCLWLKSCSPWQLKWNAEKEQFDGKDCWYLKKKDKVE